MQVAVKYAPLMPSPSSLDAANPGPFGIGKANAPGVLASGSSHYPTLPAPIRAAGTRITPSQQRLRRRHAISHNETVHQVRPGL